MGIRFDERNLLAAVVGKENGLTPAEIAAEESRALGAFRDFEAQLDADRYGFAKLPLDGTIAAQAEEFAASLRGTYDTVCLVGIGGSALGAWALDCGIRGPHPVQGAFTTSHPRLVILDNVDPVLTASALASMDPAKTVTVVIAKSGATAETVSTFLIVREWMGTGAASRIVAVTTDGAGDLYELARKENYRIFEIPKNVGGRFSVLSAVGLVPAALIGLNIRALLRGAAEMTATCRTGDLASNIALRAALHHWLIWTRQNKPIQVAFPYSNQLWGTAFWFRQLWAESLGKAKKRTGEETPTGQTPVAALGVTDQHSQVQLYVEGPNDKVFTFWGVEKFSAEGKIPSGAVGAPAFDALAGRSLAELIHAERRATEAALALHGRPNCTFLLDRIDEEHLGAFLQLMEFETAFMGEFLNIDAFNQEGVELGKKLTYALMGRAGFDEYRAMFDDYERRRGGA